MGDDQEAMGRPLLRFVLWLTLIAALALWWSFDPSNRGISVVAGAAATISGVYVFVAHGGPRVTVLGLMAYASSMFVGAAGVYAALDDTSRAQTEYLAPAILAGMAFAVLTSMAWPRVSRITITPAAPHVTRWLTRWGVLALAALIVLRLANVGFAAWIEGAALAATATLAVGVLWKPSARLISPGMALVAASFIAYALIFHTGGGRLRIVALACVLAILVTARFPRRSLKWGVVAATPVALYLLARQRLTLQEQLSGVATGNNGLESALVPIVNFSVLLRDQAEGRGLDFGFHYLSIPAAFLPESWVPWAPDALGYQLVEFQDPDKLGTGFTTAATIAAEPVFSFGLFGILLFAPVFAWLLRVMDDRIASAASRDIATRTGALQLVLWAMIGGAVADLAWAGTHIFVMRTVLRLPFWLGLGVLALLADALERRRTPTPLPLHAPQLVRR